MTKIYTLVSFVLLTVLSHAQVDILLVSDPGNTYNGDTVTVITNSTSKTLYMECKNTSGAAFDMQFRRVIMSSTATFTDQFCDNQLCYPLATQGNDWTAPNPNPINDTDTSDMKPVYDITAGGAIHIRYYVLDGSNGNAMVDSVDVMVTAGLSFEETSYEISAYPNPATDVFNMNVVTNGNQLQVKLYNVLGEAILSTNLTDGANKLDVGNLTNGVYFYSVIKNNKAVETKKLIIRK
jgi:Secretion system C-terminal sorting domain